ncbi:NMD3 family protein [Ostertagia ostertagi]
MEQIHGMQVRAMRFTRADLLHSTYKAMEEFRAETTVGLIACCQCGLPIQPNAANMCSGCIRSKVDITEGIGRSATIYICKFCDRYFVPPSGWMRAELESKELLSICLKKLKPQLLKVRLTDACFVWTEPHSKRVKVKLTIQKEVFSSTILQQTFIVEFTIHNQMCDDCRRAEAKDFWRACVQVRQKAEFKKTLFYLEQLLLKHSAHSQCTGVKPVPTGIDFFFAKLQDARKFVDFLMMVNWLSHDTKNNTYDYKHTFCVEIVHICRDNIVCMPKKVASTSG